MITDVIFFGKNQANKHGRGQAKKESSRDVCARRIRAYAFLLLAVGSLASCQTETQGQDRKDGQQPTAADEKNYRKPDVDIKVNKHYDEKGNLVGIDSTYASFYADVNGDTTGMSGMMRSFRQSFFDETPGMYDPFRSIFENDSLRWRGMYDDPWFRPPFTLPHHSMSPAMQRMDSIVSRHWRQMDELIKQQRAKTETGKT